MTDFPPMSELLPHGPPMLLLDEVLEAGPEHAVCTLTLRRDSLFMRDDRVQCVVAIEYMAQAVGAYIGLQTRKSGGPPRAGFLVGAREATFAVDELQAGDVLEVRVDVIAADDVRGSFHCRVSRRGTQVAAATLSIYGGPAPASEDA